MNTNNTPKSSTAKTERSALVAAKVEADNFNDARDYRAQLEALRAAHKATSIFPCGAGD